MSDNWYQMTADETAEALNTDATQGLSEAEATARLAKYGPNELVERDVRSPWQILIEQFKGFMTLILIGAAVISLVLGDLLEAIVILVIVVLNAVLGFFQEYKAEQSMAALKRMSVPTVRVRRDGQHPGDLGARAGARRYRDPGDRQRRRRPMAASCKASTCASRRRR